MRILRLASLIWTSVLLVVTLASLLLLGARFFVLPFLSAAPTVVAVSPSSGARDVTPLTGITIAFSAPMNPPSVARALRIEPPVEGVFAWDATRTTLYYTPTTALQAGTRYRLALDEAALGRLFRPLRPALISEFTTAQAPAVTAVWPADGSTGVPIDTSLSVRFSRPIVPLAALAQPATLPELRFDPPLAGEVIWLDPSTLLFRPAQPLRAGTRYRAALAPDLADQHGGRLGREYAWTFTTLAPAVREVAPSPNARQVPPRAPLRLLLSQPVDLQSLPAALSIDPAAPGTLDAATLDDGTQVITYTPTVDWQPGVAYTVALRESLPDGTPFLAAPYRWSFVTSPQPALIGRFPGEGQVLLPERDIRLIFSTPMDAGTLRDALRIDPPAGDLRLTTSDGEVRLDAQLQAATLYTMTIPASLTDRAGVPLGREYQLRFITAPAAPSLALPEAAGRTLRIPPGWPADVLLRRTNLSALRFELYRLDEATLLRLLGFNDSDWATFEPARYGLTLLRAWSQPLADPLNTTVDERISITLDNDAPLPPDVYFMRMRSVEGAGADTVLFVSRATLSLHVAGDRALVWATDSVSADPLSDLPLALYQQGVLARAGRTDERGIWEIDLAGINQRGLVAVSGGDQPALALPEPGVTPARMPRYHVLLATDRTTYAPGDRVLLGGYVRQAGAQSLETPPPGLMLRLEMRDPSGTRVDDMVAIDPSGMISSSLALAPNAPPGVYRLTMPDDGAGSTITFLVRAPPSALQLSLDGPMPDRSGLVARTPEGLPVAGAVVSWTVDVEPVPPPVVDDFVFGRREETPAAGWSGSGISDESGRVPINFDAAQHAAGLRYRVRAHVTEPGGLTATFDETLDVAPLPIVGVRLPLQLVAAGDAAGIEVLVMDGNRPLPAQRVQVEVLQPLRAMPDRDGAIPFDERLLVREIITSADGRARLSVTPTRAGAYRVRVSLARAGSPVAPVETTLHVYQPGFTSWDRPGHGATLIADRRVYQPGDTALLLPVAPLPDGPALLTVSRPGNLRAELRQVRAGEPITLTLAADDVPGVQVTLTPGGDPAAAAGPLTIELPLAIDVPPLTASLVADAQEYAPGATAALTLTLAGPGDSGVPADVLVRVAPAGAAAGELPLVWRSERTGTDGIARLTVPLPWTRGTFEVRVWAASERGLGEAQIMLQVLQPLAAQLVIPPFARVGDAAEVAVHLESTMPLTREAQVTLGPAGGAVSLRTVAVPPGGSTSVALQVAAPAATGLDVSATIAADEIAPQTLKAAIPILPPATTVVSGGGALVTDRFTTSIVVPTEAASGWGLLEIEVAPSPDALALAHARRLAARPERSVLDEAAVLLLAGSLPDARPEARAALDRLAALQRRSGEWSWQPGGQPQPAVTAIALEALAHATAAGLVAPGDAIDRAVLAATRLARDSATPPDVRACLIYALARSGITGADLPDPPPADALRADGLACRLLAAAPEQAATDDALPKLITRARRESGMAWWAGQIGGALPHGDAATTALAALALHHASAEQTLVTEATRWLVAHATPDGWGDSYSTGRVLHTLRAVLPSGTEAGVTLALNGAPVAAPANPNTVLRIVPLPLAELRPANTLVVTSDGSPAILAWRLTWLLPQSSGGAGVLREYLDPQSGRRIDPAALRTGQLVRVRLTLVVPGERRFVTVRDELPAGLTLVDGARAAFEHVATSLGQIELSAATLPPGIFEYSYLARAVIPGRYAAPPPALVLPGGMVLPGVATASTVRITRDR